MNLPLFSDDGVGRSLIESKNVKIDAKTTIKQRNRESILGQILEITSQKEQMVPSGNAEGSRNR